MKKIITFALAILMVVSLTACGPANKASGESPVNTKSASVNQTQSAEPTAEPVSKGIDPELKAFLDSYEAFIDEYVAFMKKYQAAKDAASMLADYADYLAKYADVAEKMNAIDQDELSAAEAAYYMEVSARIMKKLAEVTP